MWYNNAAKSAWNCEHKTKECACDWLVNDQRVASWVGELITPALLPSHSYQAAGSLAVQSAHQHISVNKQRTVGHWTGVWSSWMSWLISQARSLGRLCRVVPTERCRAKQRKRPDRGYIRKILPCPQVFRKF